MKRKGIISLLFVILILAASCATTKRDCRGNKKYKHPNGFYMEP